MRLFENPQNTPTKEKAVIEEHLLEVFPIRLLLLLFG